MKTKFQEKMLGTFTKHASVLGCFFILFSYGLMLLMIGYTSPQVSKLLFKGDASIGLQLIPAVPQALGLVVGTFSLKILFRHFNIRTILLAGFALGAVMIVLTSQLDHLTNAKFVKDPQKPNSTHNENYAAALGAYLPINFFFGLGICFSSPITSTYLGTIYSGKKRAYLISAINGVYGFGAGIIPLAIAGTILKNANDSTNFDAIRYFFYISLACCIGSFLFSFFLNYRFPKETLETKGSSKTMTAVEKVKEAKLKKVLPVTIAMIFVFFFSYLIFETGANYGLSSKYVNFKGSSKTGYDDLVDNDKINLIRGVGLFFLIQGLWRSFSAIIFKKFSYRFLILFSAVFVAIGYIILAAGVLKPGNVGMVYLVAILFGIGIGNCWPILFSFVQAALEEKRSFVGVVSHMCTMFSILTSIIIANFALGQGGTPSIPDSARTAYCIISAVLGFVIFGAMTFLNIYLKKNGFENSDEVGRKGLFGLKNPAPMVEEAAEPKKKPVVAKATNATTKA